MGKRFHSEAFFIRDSDGASALFSPKAWFPLQLLHDTAGCGDEHRSNRTAAAVEELQQKLPGMVEVLDHPGMHTTDTVDFDVVVSGEVYLELNDVVEVLLKVPLTAVFFLNFLSSPASPRSRAELDFLFPIRNRGKRPPALLAL